jgi:hypothetical protein
VTAQLELVDLLNVSENIVDASPKLYGFIPATVSVVFTTLKMLMSSPVNG